VLSSFCKSTSSSSSGASSLMNELGAHEATLPLGQGQSSHRPHRVSVSKRFGDESGNPCRRCSGIAFHSAAPDQEIPVPERDQGGARIALPSRQLHRGTRAVDRVSDNFGHSNCIILRGSCNWLIFVLHRNAQSNASLRRNCATSRKSETGFDSRTRCHAFS
jgi:hypothetical protein